MIRPGDKSYFINSLDYESLPGRFANHTLVDSNINLMAIVEADDKYFHYKGSIAHPECHEDVLWYVYEK